MKTIFLFISGLFIVQNTYTQDKLVESNNNFAFRIYKATKPNSDNFFISPLSLNIALAIANEGAQSATRKEMDELLCVQGIDNRSNLYDLLIRNITDLNDENFKNCMEFSKDTTYGNSLYIANSLWINKELKVYDYFRNTAKGYYHSEVFGFSKNNIDAANKKLNQWILDHTNQLINIPKGLNGIDKLSIVNAIYFMGTWGIPFDPEKTEEKKFLTLDKEKIDIDFMKDRSHYTYYEDKDIQSIYLPYQCDQFAMIVILPKKNYGILDVEKKLGPDYLKKIQQKSSSHEVILSFPKFKIETTIHPVEAIKNMGYTGMFSNTADFSGISDIPLKIGDITHKTYIEVDEKKTEAAAVTIVTVIGYGVAKDPPPPPKIFNANHPFIFLIMDNRTGAILFTGRFVRG